MGALIDDLFDRGLDKRVLLVVTGEFGRSPKLEQAKGRPGRDHWPQVASCLLAGGGMRMGQVIGSTNRLGEVPQDRPVHYQEVFATLYNRLGIDAENATIPDQAGRPQYLVDHTKYQPLPELI